MEQNFFITNSENQNYASTRAQELGGVVLVLGTSVHEASSITASNNHVSAEKNSENENIWTVKISEWHTNCGDGVLTYSDSGIENYLLQTGVAIPSSVLPVGVYAVVLPAFVQNQQEEVLSYIANVLCEHGSFAIVVVSNGSDYESKTAGGDS